MQGDLIDKAKMIKVLLLDVDGVLTDGRIIYDSAGRDMKLFDVHDGLGVALLHKSGIPTVLITAKGSRAIKPRAKDMKVARIYENISPKTAVLDKIIKKYKIKPEELCFIGDDLVDLCLLKRVGLAVSVANACAEVKKISHYTTAKEGGRGAVREVAEMILKSQGKWQEAIRKYEA
ncbi:MAG: HAD-IIIA family hydrolase [Candidatus Omnitrophota bacterium]|jgi:3-deoxy-D-manno-octulosonate 8-phosphate phosphatase (KDO 8-P phosphatase)|nr:MAG: HAD-IIIA family hydrolase [Candidatus Omnitrophota bacterium]